MTAPADMTDFQRAMTAGDEPVVTDATRAPNSDEVICPNCTHQFRAIPVNVQAEIAALKADAERLDATACSPQPSADEAMKVLRAWVEWESRAHEADIVVGEYDTLLDRARRLVEGGK